MSFCMVIKGELCKLPIANDCCAVAELYGFMLYANTFSMDKIVFYSEGKNVRKRVGALVQKTLGERYTLIDDDSGGVIIENIEIIRKIFTLFGYEFHGGSLHLNRAVIEDDCCKWSFLRGVFLASGYLSEPAKEYHLELVTPYFSIANEVLLLIQEMGMAVKKISRRGNYVIYSKNGEVMERFLGEIGAAEGVLEFILKKVEKSFRNKMNRVNNCDVANIAKASIAAFEQIEAINKLMEKDLFDTLPAALRETAALRVENPELTLSELAAMSVPPLTKPGISGRMRKLIKLAKEV